MTKERKLYRGDHHSNSLPPSHRPKRASWRGGGLPDPAEQPQGLLTPYKASSNSSYVIKRLLVKSIMSTPQTRTTFPILRSVPNFLGPPKAFKNSWVHILKNIHFSFYRSLLFYAVSFMLEQQITHFPESRREINPISTEENMPIYIKESMVYHHSHHHYYHYHTLPTWPIFLFWLWNSNIKASI